MQNCGFCYITHSTYTGHEVDWRKDRKKQSASTNQVDDVRETQVIDGNVAWDGQEVKTVLDALPDVLPDNPLVCPTSHYSDISVVPTAHPVSH